MLALFIYLLDSGKKIVSVLKIVRRINSEKRHLWLCVAHYGNTVLFQVKAVGIRETMTTSKV